MKRIEIVPHDARWRDKFEAEVRLVTAALGEAVVAVHHIGSTAVSGIYAKPIIDILVEVVSLDDVDIRNDAMKALGYEVMGEFGIAGRRYFRKDDRRGTRTHQIHAFATGSDEIARHLAFRDYMTDHPAEAQAYSDLKQRLAAEFAGDPESYMDGKDAFIRDIDRKAAMGTD